MWNVPGGDKHSTCDEGRVQGAAKCSCIRMLLYRVPSHEHLRASDSLSPACFRRKQMLLLAYDLDKQEGNCKHISYPCTTAFDCIQESDGA